MHVGYSVSPQDGGRVVEVVVVVGGAQEPRHAPGAESLTTRNRVAVFADGVAVVVPPQNSSVIVRFVAYVVLGLPGVTVMLALRMATLMDNDPDCVALTKSFFTPSESRSVYRNPSLEADQYADGRLTQ